MTERAVRPSQFMVVLFWLLLVVIYSGVTELPVVNQPKMGINSASDGGSILDTPLDRLQSSMHILIADRQSPVVRIKEMIVREGVVELSVEQRKMMADQPPDSVGREIGQFFQNEKLDRLYLDLDPTTAVYIGEYRRWSTTAFRFALGALIVGMLWLIIIQALTEQQKLREATQFTVWRWSTLAVLVLVTALHSLMVYYQGGILVSPIGLVATAILPLLAVQVVVIWEGFTKSWPLFLPIVALVLGHWWAQVEAARMLDSATTAFLADLFTSHSMYQIVYVVGVGTGLFSIIKRNPTAAPAPAKDGAPVVRAGQPTPG